MNEFNFNHLTIKYDNSSFSAYEGDICYYDNVSLNEPPWNDEHEAILKEIKKRLKISARNNNKELSEKLKTFGALDIGKDYYPCRIDKRLIAEMKARNLVITKFINSAIAEKLTRDLE